MVVTSRATHPTSDIARMNALTRGLFHRHRLPSHYPLWRSLIARTMSYEASLSKLPSPLKDLVANAQADTGRTDTDKLEVISWIDKVAAGNTVKSESFSVSLLAQHAMSTDDLFARTLLGLGIPSGSSDIRRQQLPHGC